MLPFSTNILQSFATDAYKVGHFLQLPKNTQAVRFYIAPRQALRSENENYIVFGIRYFIEKYLKNPLTYQDIEDAKNIWKFFNPNGASTTFPEEGFKKIVAKYKGFLPVKIVGVKEGSILNKYNVPVFVISVDDPDLVWLPGFIETALQRSIWYPSTVATISYNVKQKLLKAHETSVSIKNYNAIQYQLHDFGARGATSGESASIGGLAHLLNFLGTDTMEAVYLGHKLYDIPINELASSILASEHSTVTSWGNKHVGEREALLNMIDTCKKHGENIFAFVSDSYDYFYTVDKIWGDPEIIKAIQYAKLSPVVRPDSGDPVEVVLYALDSLSKSWGYTTNEKGYKVLNTIRIIQGDGMNIERISTLIDAILEQKYSVENVSFGMGGGLLQNLNRDSMSWSMKMYKLKQDDVWRDIRKSPLTQQNKESYNPQNVVDDTNWVTHYQWDSELPEPIIYTESFQNIRKRTTT